ncbi:MAG: universal stress protein [Bacteroidetes bacterium]|nr:universal stress protein [Rhodothermia bacterium]MCS7155719.1 universal stress protein [Bacteroidota bacterium]MCX7906573.1 universal stress protein [Bacteroidota bacterium]MDW8137146.1 universal stress protein [Bacteroidota bacterium]MDW8284984.1 universal stress protein [Bacteroidota bacterium]
MPFRRLLVPLDFSDRSPEALKLAARLAERFASEAIPLYVLAPLPAIDPVLSLPFELYGPAAVPDDEKRRQEALDYLRTYLAEQGYPAWAQAAQVRLGAPAIGIVEAARELHCDLILLGTHGRSGLARWLLGSTTERVVRTSSVPVWVFRGEPERPIRHILLPTDFSDLAAEAYPLAVQLARAFEAKITLFYVAEYVPLSDSQLLERLRAEYQEKLERERLTRFGEEERRWVQEAYLQFNLGSSTAGIVDFAARKEIDLIVMSTHGYSGLKHILLGSTTEYVVRHAPCSVLTIRPPAMRST